MSPEELQKTTVEEYCFQKFRKGALEHKEEWSYEVIKPLYQMLEELADLYNYADLVSEKYPTLGNRHKKIAKELWEEIRSQIIVYKQ